MFVQVADNITDGELNLDPSLVEISDVSRLSFDATSGEWTSTNRVHMLTSQTFTIPLLVECDLKTTNNSAALLLGNIVYENNVRMNDGSNTTIKNNVNWLTSAYEQTLGLYIKDATGALTAAGFPGADPNTEKVNYRTFSVFVSADEIIGYIDGVQRYRYVKATTSFPDWADVGGSVRIGLYASGNNCSLKNFKVG